MHQQRQSGRGDERQRFTQVRFADVIEFVHAGRTEKALEAEHAGARKRLDLAGVAGHDAAPEADIDMTPAVLPRGASRQARQPWWWMECC